MAQLTNNQFSSDSDDVRQARLDLLSANIDTHAVDIAVAGELLSWAQNTYGEFVDARSSADKEAGDTDEAYQEFHIKYNAAREYYVDAKDLLKAVLMTYQDDDDAMEKYGIKGRTPRTEESLLSAIQQWRKTHDEFVAEADPRVIAESIVAKMESDADEFDNLWRTAVTEKKEARLAFDSKQEIFSRDTDNLRLVYMLAKMAWGDDDPRLHELGFVPSSEIWTPGQPDPELPVFPNPPEIFTLSLRADGTIEVVWTGVTGATHMLLEKRKQGEIDWSLVMNGLPADPEEILPYIDPYISPGIWEYRMIPTNGEEHGMEIVAVIVVPEG